MVDVDDTMREVHGYAKQGGAFGYTKQRGLNIQLATIATPLAAPVIAPGQAGAEQQRLGQGAGWLLARPSPPPAQPAVSWVLTLRVSNPPVAQRVAGAFEGAHPRSSRPIAGFGLVRACPCKTLLCAITREI